MCDVCALRMYIICASGMSNMNTNVSVLYCEVYVFQRLQELVLDYLGDFCSESDLVKFD